MIKKILTGIVLIIVLLFTGTVIYQNYLIAPITAYHTKSVWKEHELNKSLQNKFPKPIVCEFQIADFQSANQTYGLSVHR